MKKQEVQQNKDAIVGRPIRLNRQVLKLTKHQKFVEVVFLGDVHIGSPQCDKKRFLGMVDYCLKNGVYVILMGDLLECATKGSVGAGVYEQDSNPSDQYEWVLEVLRPLAEDNLILGVHGGNHEERIYKDSGFNVSKALARELKVRYLGDACWSQFKVGGETYLLYTLHGRTGSRFDGTALLALERISVSFYADLVAMGHAHKCINSIVLQQRIVNGMVKEHKKHLIITGGYLKYDAGYGQTLGLPISKLGSPKVKFFSDRHDMVVSW